LSPFSKHLIAREDKRSSHCPFNWLVTTWVRVFDPRCAVHRTPDFSNVDEFTRQASASLVEEFKEALPRINNKLTYSITAQEEIAFKVRDPAIANDVVTVNVIGIVWITIAGGIPRTLAAYDSYNCTCQITLRHVHRQEVRVSPEVSVLL
jgi:hypothetical protein